MYVYTYIYIYMFGSPQLYMAYTPLPPALLQRSFNPSPWFNERDSSFNGGLYLEMIQEKKDEKDVSLKRLQTGVDKIDEAEFGAGPTWETSIWNRRSTRLGRPTDADQFSLYMCVSL